MLPLQAPNWFAVRKGSYTQGPTWAWLCLPIHIHCQTSTGAFNITADTLRKHIPRQKESPMN